MYSDRSYQLRKEEYNYLLPVLGKQTGKRNLFEQGDRCYFIGNTEELDDMLRRLTGLYDYWDELNPTVIYRCGFEGSIYPFRDFIKVPK